MASTLAVLGRRASYAGCTLVVDVLANAPTGWEPLVQLTRIAPTGSASIPESGVVPLSSGDLLDG